MNRIVPRALALLLLLAVVAAPARAAESYDACSGFITALPTTIGTGGTFCLSGDLATSMTSLAAIQVDADDVTLDCNGYIINGLGGGAGTHAQGVRAIGRRHVTIRHCHFRGFEVAVVFGSSDTPSGQHLVEDNRVENAQSEGIVVYGPGSVIRRNQVLDIVSTTQGQGAFGIYAAGNGVDVVDNLVSNIQSKEGGAVGIYSDNANDSSIRGNLVRGVRRIGTSGSIFGLRAGGNGRTVIRNNTLVGEVQAGSIGLSCDGASLVAKDNVIQGFATNKVGCSNDNNLLKP